MELEGGAIPQDTLLRDEFILAFASSLSRDSCGAAYHRPVLLILGTVRKR